MTPLTHAGRSNDFTFESAPEGLAIGVVGAILSTCFVLTYVVYVGALALASLHPLLQQLMAVILPPFPLPSLRGLCIGLARSVLWGWYIALVFCPVHNFYVRQLRQ